jgi:MoaA/NifB/PqqE/SkfB family radical SAM enzyme
MCHFSLDHVFNQKPTVLTPGNFEKILKSIHPYARKLTLSAAYEPLVSPHVAEIFELCGKYPIPEVTFLTNGTLLTERIAESVIRTGITEVCFSLHAGTEETYNQIVKGGNFQKTLRNIALISELKKGGGKPKLHVNVALMKSNIRELEKIVVLAHKLGVASVSFRHLILFEDLGMEKESLALVDSDKAVANYWIQRALEKASDLKILVLNSPDFFAVAPRLGFHRSRPWKNILSNYAKGRKLRRIPPIGNTEKPECEEFGYHESIEFSGWALSSGGAPDVSLKLIYRDGEIIDIGNAVFHNATRADVSALYPQYPESYRSGWTFLFKPGSLRLRQPEFAIHVVARDRRRNQATIGVKKIRLTRDISPKPFLYCTKPFDSLYIDVHGFVFPYPDCHTAHPFGSLFDSQLEDIWYSVPFIELREAVIQGRPPDFCRRCPMFINRQVDSPEFFQPHRDFSSESVR